MSLVPSEFFQESDARAIAAMVSVRQISDQSRKRGSRGDPEKDVGGMLPLRRPRLVGMKTQSLRLVLEHRKEPYDQMRCGAHLNSFSSLTPEQCRQWLTMAG